MGYPTAAAGSFLLLPAGHRSFAHCRSEPGPLSLINKASSGVLPHIAQFRALFDLGLCGSSWVVARAGPADGGSFMEAMTMTAWICRQRLGPAKRPLYPQVMSSATSPPRFVALLDGLLSKGN
jgi:hypothetical protein